MNGLFILFGIFALLTGGYYNLGYLAVIGLGLIIFGVFKKPKGKKK